MSAPAQSSKFQPFVPAARGDSRSPCPALNALANHSYLPHDGRNISSWQLASAIGLIYKISWPLAWLLSLAGTLVCGSGFHLNLHDLALHNRIEHDGSLAHKDALPGQRYAPSVPSLHELDTLLSLQSGPGLTTYGMEDFALARVTREKKLPTKLSFIHKRIAMGESALTLKALGDAEGRVRKDQLMTWYLEERLPGDWEGPRDEITLLGTAHTANQIGGLMKRDW